MMMTGQICYALSSAHHPIPDIPDIYFGIFLPDPPDPAMFLAFATE